MITSEQELKLSHLYEIIHRKGQYGEKDFGWWTFTGWTPDKLIFADSMNIELHLRRTNDMSIQDNLSITLVEFDK